MVNNSNVANSIYSPLNDCGRILLTQIIVSFAVLWHMGPIGSFLSIAHPVQLSDGNSMGMAIFRKITYLRDINILALFVEVFNMIDMSENNGRVVRLYT